MTSRPSCRRRWKKHVCASRVTWWRIDSSPSISTPRSRTTGWMTLWPTLMTLFSDDSLRRFVSEPNHRISVLVAFSCSRFAADHELTSQMQSSTPRNQCANTAYHQCTALLYNGPLLSCFNKRWNKKSFSNSAASLEWIRSRCRTFPWLWKLLSNRWLCQTVHQHQSWSASDSAWLLTVSITPAEMMTSVISHQLSSVNYTRSRNMRLTRMTTNLTSASCHLKLWPPKVDVSCHCH